MNEPQKLNNISFKIDKLAEYIHLYVNLKVAGVQLEEETIILICSVVASVVVIAIIITVIIICVKKRQKELDELNNLKKEDEKKTQDEEEFKKKILANDTINKKGDTKRKSKNDENDGKIKEINEVIIKLHSVGETSNVNKLGIKEENNLKETYDNLDITDQELAILNKGSLLNDQSKLEATSISIPEPCNSRLNIDVKHEIVTKTFKEKIKTLEVNDESKLDENINDLIQKNLDNELQDNVTEKSRMSSLSNAKAVKLINFEVLNHYASGERSVPNESFFDGNLEDFIRIEKEIEKEKEDLVLDLKAKNNQNRHYFKVGGKNSKPISSNFNVNNNVVMTDFDIVASDLKQFEYINEK